MERKSLVIEGMTASGKTTASNLLSDKLKMMLVDEVFRDPYDLLRRFHFDTKWAFSMQLQFLSTRYAQYLCAFEENQEGFIMDRSLYGDRVYATLYYSLGYFSKAQYETYLSLWEELSSCIEKPDLMVIFYCPFAVSWQRIKTRGREDEIEVGEGYWRNLHVAYENFAQKMTQQKDFKVLTINTEEINLVDDEAAKNRFSEYIAARI